MPAYGRKMQGCEALETGVSGDEWGRVCNLRLIWQVLRLRDSCVLETLRDVPDLSEEVLFQSSSDRPC